MRLAALASVLTLIVTVGAGCGDDDEPTATSTTPPTEETTTTDGGATGAAEQSPEGEENASDSQGATDEATIEKNAATAVGSNDPDVACGELVTDRYLQDAYGGRGGCRDAVAAQPSTEVAVKEIEVDGDQATATAVPEGGPLAGEDIEVRLLFEAGGWRVDFVRARVPAGP